MEPHLVKTSKKMSWLLRHGAAEAGVAMDEAGWVAVADVLRALRLDRATLDAVVRDNEKQRFQLDGDRIRACQGHSTAGAAVTLDELEASWTVRTSPAPVWHGTRIEAVASIAREGIRPVARTHVHLAPALDSVVGKRAAVQVMLEVSPAKMAEAGLKLFDAPNGVVLARQVPPACIVGLRPFGRNAEAEAGRLRRVLGIAE